MESTPNRHNLLLWSTLIIATLLAGSAAAFLYFKFQLPGRTITLRKPELSLNGLHYGASPALANSNYFNTIKNSFEKEGVSFVEADLSAMKLRVHEKSAVVLEVPILTKGREGSWWETPAGVYKIESKERNHFSSIGKVYQPYSMAFQGNFFIHGWPYHPDGTEVSSTFSGGCIRLSTDDAKKVYDLVSTDMPVLVYEKDFTKDAFQYTRTAPNVTAERYLVADLKNDAVLVEKGMTDKVPVASITKLVTALVAAEYINLEKQITITQESLATTSKPRLWAGQKVTVYDLLFPLLQESSNEAAEAIARNLGRNYFINLMNQKALSMGMTSTTFADPSGSSAHNISTAQDLFALAKYIYNNRSFVFKLSSGTLTSSAYGETSFRNLKNFNKFATVPDTLVGGKIGKTTAANETYLAVFDVTVKGERRPIVVVVLGSQNVETDVAALLSYFHAQYP